MFLNYYFVTKQNYELWKNMPYRSLSPTRDACLQSSPWIAMWLSQGFDAWKLEYLVYISSIFPSLWIMFRAYKNIIKKVSNIALMLIYINTLFEVIKRWYFVYLPCPFVHWGSLWSSIGSIRTVVYKYSILIIIL